VLPKQAGNLQLKEVYVMVMTDPIADFLTRIRNGNMVMHETVEVPSSKIKAGIAEILREEGYIKDLEYIEDGKQGIIRIYLKYGPNKERIITGIKRISKPGLRVYVKKDEIPKVLGGLGTAVLSTSKGLMTDKRARQEKIGGEVICYIW
jgi:small subunit ribosomal protein S8